MDTNVKTTTKLVLKTPSMWRVDFHNDDFTPFDFVAFLLIELFGKTEQEAYDLALRVHSSGRAQVALCTKEVALSKQEIATRTAESYGHPLTITAEEA